MKIFKNIVKWIFILIAIFIGYIVLYNFLGRVMFHNEYPTIMGYGFTSVKEDSYDKKYRIGDLIIIKKQDRYDVGDYIVYKKNDKQVVEQIKKLTETGYITIESLDSTDYEINRGFVKGKVAKNLKMGSFSNFLTSPLGLFAVLFLFVLFMFTSKR